MRKRTDTQYDNTARFEGQRFGKLIVAVECKGNCEENGGITNRIAKKEN